MSSMATSIGNRLLASVVCASLLFGQVTPAFAAPSQIPLVNRPENTPHPNFMLTLDDSGSMTYQYLPERSFTLNGQTVAFPNDGKVFVHPDEIAANIFTGTGRIVGEQGGTDTTFVTATLTESEFDTEARKLYQLQMRSPQVNRIYYNPALKYLPWAKADGSRYPNAVKTAANLDPAALDASSTGANQATVDLTNTVKTYTVRWYCGAKAGGPSYFTCDRSSKSFNPAIFYLLADNANPNTATVGEQNYRLYNLNDTTTEVVYPKAYPKRSGECTVTQTRTTCSKSQEWINFANWFVYYRSRLFIAKASIPEAINDLGDTVRLGWSTIHSGRYSVDGMASTIVQQGVRDLSQAHKNTFTAWIRGLGTYAQTPSKDAVYEVGQYFKRSDARSPWSTNMEEGTPLSSHLQCRRSFNILVTDGYYRQSNTELKNIDNTATTPSSTSNNTYTPAYPFKDSASNTLADFAMEFWKNDLQPDIKDKVKPTTVLPSGANPTALDQQVASIKSDPATWQHLTQFMVGFGVTGTLQRSDDTLKQLINCGNTGGVCWPTNPVNEIDDLWHAAINSRGEYFDVNTPDDLKSAIQSAVSRGTPPLLKEAGVATAASTLITNNVKFVPEYTPIAWTGDVKAFPLDENGKASTSAIWSAAAALPTSRNIYVWDTVNKSAYAFQGSTVYANEHTRNLLSSGSSEDVITALVNYLRGDTLTSADYRVRTGRLPDFVNSTPLFVKEGADLGYSTLPETQGGGLYQTYRGKKSGSATTDTGRRTGSALIIGGNGGMLHAFDATSGVEQFAFIPETAVPNLTKLTRRDYGYGDNQHQYFVDGPLIETDVYATIGGTTAWSNLVYGTMGAGGKSIFALKLNMADPSALSASSVLWESTASQSDDMGYMTSEPQVGVLPNGDWKVFVGNGVDSNSGKAALLVIDAVEGTVESVPAYAPPTPTTASDRSGLGGVRLVKNSLGQVIAAYAGDIKGNLWRFEYDTANQRMRVGYGGAPLFRAFGPTGTIQPITATPLVTVNSSRQGQMVVFGTGRLLYESDSADTSTQTVYGVLDKVPADQSTTSSANDFTLTRADRNLLIQQNITTLTSVAQLNSAGTSKTFIDISTQEGTGTRTQGWLLDLVVPQSNATDSAKDYPKAIYPVQAFGKSVLITTVKPAVNAESCDNTLGMGYAFFLNAQTGNKNVLPSLDADGNGTIGTGDGNFAGWIFDGGPQTIIKNTPPTGNDPPPPCDKASFQSANGDILAQDCSDPTMKPIKDRIWRQLFNPPQPLP